MKGERAGGNLQKSRKKGGGAGRKGRMDAVSKKTSRSRWGTSFSEDEEEKTAKRKEEKERGFNLLQDKNSW